ncbi:MAG: hypothetical protein Q6363_004795 [Candidatus Njordarchaeota archaeon]
MSEDARTARAEIEQILKGICNADGYALGAVLVDVRTDLVVMKYAKPSNVANVGPVGEIELSGGILGKLIPAIKELCSETRLNLGNPFFSVVIADRGTAVIHIVTDEFVIVFFGVRGMNISFIAQQLANEHPRIKTLIDKAQFSAGTEEWGF